MTNSSSKKILCIGAGYVGGPSMAVLASKCPEHTVTVVDLNAERIAAWNSEELPIFEPGLDDVVRQTRGKNLFFDTDIPKGIVEADIIFVCVNTPTKTFGKGAGMASDLQYIEKVARGILECSRSDKIVVEKSTIPVRTAEAIKRILGSATNGARFQVISNPEFLAEGSGVNDMLEPDRVLIGSDQNEEGKAAAQEIIDLYTHWIPRERILTTNLWSSELSKLVANAFLAQRVSSINSITALCELTGADIGDVSSAIGMDSRIGSRFLRPSVGFGGSCFKKDILNLVYISRAYGLEEVAGYWEAVVKMNNYQMNRFVDRMVETMFNTVAGKRIALFGFAFKTETGDTRESPAITVARRLLEERAHLVVTDPKALRNARGDLEDTGSEVLFTEDPYAAAEGSHAIAVVTGWKEYAGLDYKRIYQSMAKPAFIFDGCNILNHNQLRETGFTVVPLGSAVMETETL